MKNIVTLISVLIFWSSSFGQSGIATADLLEARKEQVHQNHKDAFVAHILTGRYYSLKYEGAKNSQFFRSKNLVKGTMVYDGVVFNDVEIQYDLYIQKIVAMLDTKNYIRHVTIDGERVSEFSIVGCDFRRIKDDTVMQEGFYQVAFEGDNAHLFIKRNMEKKESIENNRIRQEFLPVDRYYIKNAFGTFPVQKKKSVLEAYNHAKEVMATIKKNKLKFSKKKREKSLIELVSLLDPKFPIN
ncbi:hypothetical protein QQ020_03100 [Fulvivirgaceae bacterium BMA12]|uniref:Uncharacterized protein n=1 Tax=Agaribacillus aureus TaxID=3051825 RepID=A0ABT8KZY3_9BACT|nr:hypothetical protein [Fulvivirgaceae bacterium BMA12]